MNFCSHGTFDNVAVSDDAIGVDKKTATSRALFAASIEGFNRNRGGLNATDEFGEEVLGSGLYSCGY
jgi:hypothetical protein